MQSILETALACVVGAVDVVPGPDGVVIHRSSAASRTRLGDPFYDFTSAVPSGVRFEAVTDAEAIEMDVALTRFQPGGAASGGSAFDLVIDGNLHEPVVTTTETLVILEPATGEVRIEPVAGPATVRFTLGPAAGLRRIEIWLPASATLTLLDVRVPEGAVLRTAAPQGPMWVHYGSSISQCSEADRPTGTWPAIVARRTGRSLVNLALGGQCQLDQFAARTIRDLPAATISLELGINIVNADSMRRRTFVSAFHGFLDTVRDGHPTTPITVVSPIICPATEDRPGPTFLGEDLLTHAAERPDTLADGALSLGLIREILRDHVALRRSEGDPNLYLVDGLALFGPDDVGDLPDGLHPNAAGYHRIADRFASLTGPELSV